MSILKPCPFCGAEAFKWHTFKCVTIECACYDVDKHRIMVSADNEPEAVRLWNARANDE